ncbi:MAG: hypothetical protein K6F14_06370 [Clostridiales bacterium]|nr:hypothetical protein [Clostridiales bacterium]
MKILFAAPDRDLLECYRKLLEEDLGETVTSFDGTQVISLLSTDDFDVLILDKKLPRVDYRKIIERADNRMIPVIVLTDEPERASLLTDEKLKFEHLSYPFTFDRVKDAICKTLAEAGQRKEKA